MKKTLDTILKESVAVLNDAISLRESLGERIKDDDSKKKVYDSNLRVVNYYKGLMSEYVRCLKDFYDEQKKN
jgi:hypothetical protein